MIHYDVIHQARYSRGELLLRTFFGWLYIAIPHLFLLFFISIGAIVLMFLAWWVVLFTGKYPRSFFNYQVNALRWEARVEARMLHLSDGYPAFGMSKEDPGIILDIPYPERLSRGHLLLRTFFGWLYCLIPHVFVLLFRGIATAFVVFFAWWVVLITGDYPKTLHAFVVGTSRWNYRLNAYIMFLTDTYPPFRGKP